MSLCECGGVGVGDSHLNHHTLHGLHLSIGTLRIPSNMLIFLMIRLLKTRYFKFSYITDTGECIIILCLLLHLHYFLSIKSQECSDFHIEDDSKTCCIYHGALVLLVPEEGNHGIWYLACF